MSYKFLTKRKGAIDVTFCGSHLFSLRTVDIDDFIAALQKAQIIANKKDVITQSIEIPLHIKEICNIDELLSDIIDDKDAAIAKWGITAELADKLEIL